MSISEMCVHVVTDGDEVATHQWKSHIQMRFCFDSLINHPHYLEHFWRFCEVIQHVVIYAVTGSKLDLTCMNPFHKQMYDESRLPFGL